MAAEGNNKRKKLDSSNSVKDETTSIFAVTTTIAISPVDDAMTASLDPLSPKPIASASEENKVDEVSEVILTDKDEIEMSQAIGSLDVEMKDEDDADTGY